MPIGTFRRVLARFLLPLLTLAAGHAAAGLGAAVTIKSGDPTSIRPGESTRLEITLSNNNSTAPITAVAFSNSLPGTLPNGLKISGAATSSCGGTLTAATGTQAITLSGGTIPVKVGGADGTCVIDIPVTAGTSSGSATSYTYTIASGAVTGNDGAAVANAGAVNQSINILALAKPTIAKNFGSTTLVLGGAATTLTITLTNTNTVAITGVSVTDVFPQLGGSGIIRVATTPGAANTCGATFAPAAGDTTINATGGTIPANGNCSLSVSVEAAQTNGAYSTGARTNTIDKATQFTNDIGIEAAADATRNITVNSPLAVTKAFSPSSLADGQTGVMTVTLANSGSSDLTVTTFDDSPIDGLASPVAGKGLLISSVGTTCASGTATIITASSENRGVRLAGGTIPAAGSCTVTANFTATTQAANTPITYTNTIAQGAVGVTAAGVVSQTASATILVADTLRVLKTNNSSNPRPGNPAAYVVTVQNWSAAAMSNVRVLDALENGQTFLAGTINGVDYTPALSGTGCSGLTVSNVTGDASANFVIATVPARTGASTPGACAITFYTMVSTTAANGSSSVNNVASGAVCTDNGAGVCNGVAAASGNSTVNTTILSATKAFSPAGPLTEGAVSRMTITVSNFSANPLNSLSISDTLPTAGAAQMRVATPANAATTCGGTITATAGATSVALNGGTVPARANKGAGAAGTCNLQVDVTGPAGAYTNTATLAGTETRANGTTHTVNASANASITFSSALSATKSFSPASVSSGGLATVTVRLANSSAIALTSVSVTDPLPTGMVVAPTPNAYSTCAGSPVVTAAAGASSASLSGAALGANGSCDLVFDVTATGAGNWVNSIPAGNITASGGIFNQSAVSATLTNAAANNLAVAKTTNPSTLTFPGQVSDLTITITNGTTAVTNLRLTDHFTSNGTSGAAANGMIVAGTPQASTTCPGGVVAATAGGTSVALSGAALAAGASCTVSVKVTSTTVGGITNFIPASAIQTNQGLTNTGQATTSLTTQSNIGVVKQFIPTVIKPGARGRLRLTFYNATSIPMTSLAVNDTLPAGLTIPSGPNPSTTCTGAVLSAPAADRFAVASGTLGAASGGTAASCRAEIDVVAAAQGDYVNTIAAGDVTGQTGGVAASNSQPTSDTQRVKQPLVVRKAFSNFTKDAGSPDGFTTGSDNKSPGAGAVMTILLKNANGTALTQASLTDALPAGVYVAPTPNASSTCSGAVVTAPASAATVRLAGATIPANGSCTVTVTVLSNISGAYLDSIAANDVATFEGVTNEEPTSAELIVSTPPTVSKQFSPAVIPPGGKATLTIFLGNANPSAITLASALTDTLPTAPGAMKVAATPNVVKTCPGGVTAAADAVTVTYANGASIPAGGCTISVDVTAPTSGDYGNTIAAGALATSLGNSQLPANATLTVSDLGYVSGRVFRDNNVAPNGTFETGTDTPISGATIELRNGADCSGSLAATKTTDSLGNYLFSGLSAGTYSACQAAQPSGTANGTTSAGTIVANGGSTGTAGTASNPTTTTSQVVNIVLGSSSGKVSGSPGNNFAEVVLSSLGGTVFRDQNNNGVQNGADTGISGVTIELLNASSTVVATTTTDSAGNYSFTGLAPGTYSIREPSQPSGTSNGITTAGAVPNGGTVGTATAVANTPSAIATIVLPPNTTSTGNNFAEIPNGRSLSGRVFVDYNNNGVADGSDYGIGGHAINLAGVDINLNAVSLSATTLSDGTYSITGIPEGSSYNLTQGSQPPATTNGITTAGTTGGTASAVGTTPSTITGISLAGGNITSSGNNFAERPGPNPDLSLSKAHSPGNFGQGSNTAYYTLTPSNIGSAATSGTITIVDTLPTGLTAQGTPTGTGWSCSVSGQTVTCTSTTVIAAGGTGSAITLRVAVASGTNGQLLTNTATVSGGGEPSGLSGNNTATDVVAVTLPASVSGRVWRDANHDRIRDASETLVSGWKVELLLNGNLMSTATTDAAGAYTFTNLSPGSGYRIRFIEPASGAVYGYAVPNETATAFTQGVVSAANPAGATTTDGTLASLTFTADTSTTQQSLPLDPGGVIYSSATRQPLAGSRAAITGPTGFDPALHLVGGTGNASQTVGANGYYQFLLLAAAPAGNYTITVTPPSGYRTPPSTAIAPAAGSLAVPAAPGVTAVQAQGTAPTGAQPTTYHFVWNMGGSSQQVVNNHIPLDLALGDITGTVFNDPDGSRTQGAGEAGIAGVAIALRNAGGTIIANAVTDANGRYSFTGLSPGSYTVVETDPAGYSSTTSNTVNTTVSESAVSTVNFGDTATPLGFTATAVCVKDTPFVDYAVTVPSGVTATGGVSFTWVKADGSTAQTLTGQPLSGRLLWPGAAVDASGNPVDWPGWDFVGGQWVQVNDGLRPTLKLVATVNPTAELTVSYPPATPQCAAEPATGLATIAGVVFNDADGSGTQGTGEAGIAGVTITLRNASGAVVATAVTDANGRYSFVRLPAGTYTVEEADPSGYTSTTANTLSVSVPAGGSGSANFGDRTPALGFTATAVCVKDTPFVDYAVTVPSGVTATGGVSFTWVKADGSTAQTLTGQPLSGRLLWPGAAVDASGNPVDWPGWDFVGGQWVQVNDGLRPTLKLVATVNPTAELTVSYPPATPQCAAEPRGATSAQITVDKSVYRGHSAGSGCPGVDELVIVDLARPPVAVTWCVEATNTGPVHLVDLVLDDPRLGVSAANQSAFVLRSGTFPLAPGAKATWYLQETRTSSLANSVTVTATPSSASGEPTGQAAVRATDSAAVFAYVFDPPFGLKTGMLLSGEPVIRWTMVWINSSPIVARGVVITDSTPEGTTFRGGLACTPRGSTTVSSCVFEGPSAAFPRGRLRVVADIGPDDGAETEAAAANELLISFDVTLNDPTVSRSYLNQGNAEWTPPGASVPLVGVTTDPAIPGSGNPTGIQVAPAAIPVPTLSQWGTLILVLLLGLAGLVNMRRPSGR